MLYTESRVCPCAQISQMKDTQRYAYAMLMPMLPFSHRFLKCNVHILSSYHYAHSQQYIVE